MSLSAPSYQYVPPVTLGQTPGIPCPTDADYALMKQIARRWEYYRGKFPPALFDEQGQPDPHSVNDNRLASIINTGVDYLLKDGIQIDVSSAGEDIQQKLDKAWRSTQKMMTFFIEEAQSGAVGGHQYWRILPPRTPDNLSQYTRFVGIPPERVAMATDPDDVNVVTQFIIEYATTLPSGGQRFKRQVFKRVDENPSATEGEDVVENWTITNYISETGYGALYQVGPVALWSQVFPPILHNKNLPNPHEVHGLTDIEDDLIALQAAVNRNKSNTDKLAWLYSHPVYWSDAVDATNVDISASGVVVVGPGATLNAIEARAAIPDLLAYIESILEDMDERSGVPQIATGRIKDSASLGRLSGTAIKLMFMRLIAKTLLKRLLYGQTYIKASQIHLHFAGVPNAFEIQPVIKWPDIVPNSAQDVQALAAAIPMLQAIGISDDSIGTMLGFDMSQEKIKKAQEDAAASLAFDQGRGPAPAPQNQPPEVPPVVSDTGVAAA